MGIGILIVAIGVIIKKRQTIQKAIIRFKNKIMHKAKGDPVENL